MELVKPSYYKMVDFFIIILWYHHNPRNNLLISEQTYHNLFQVFRHFWRDVKGHRHVVRLWHPIVDLKNYKQAEQAGIF